MSDDVFTLDDIGYGAQKPSPNAVPTGAPNVAPPADETFSAGDIGYKRKIDEQPSVSTAEDVARSAVAGAEKGALVDVGSLPGVVHEWIGKGLDLFKSKEGLAESRAKETEGLSNEELQAIEEGRAVPYGGSTAGLLAAGGMFTTDPRLLTEKMGTVPTAKGTEKQVEQEITGAKYVPQTTAGDIAGAGVRGMTSGAIMGGTSGAVTGLTAGAAGRGAADVVKGFSGSSGLATGTEVGVNIATDFLTRKLSTSLTGTFNPSNQAVQELAKTIRIGLAKDPERAKQLADAIERGEKINVNDFLDKTTLDQIKKNVKGDFGASVTDFLTKLQKRAADNDVKLSEDFKSVFGVNMDDVNWANTQKAANEAKADQIYDLARSNPKSSFVWSPEISNAVFNDGNVMDAAAEVTKSILEKKAGKLNSASPLLIRIGKDGKPIINPNSKPDLAYWDAVKRKLDDWASHSDTQGLSNAGKPFAEGAANLRNAVSGVIPEYSEARLAGQIVKTAPDALADGMQLGKTLVAEKPNFQKIDDVLYSFSKASPELKNFYRQGVARSLYQTAQSGDFSEISRLMSGTKSSQALKMVLGESEYNEIYGAMARNAVMRTETGLETSLARMQQRGEQASGFWQDIKLGGIPGGAVGASAYLTSAPEMVKGAALLTAAAGGVAIKAILDKREQALSGEIMRLVTSTDPVDLERLGKALASDPKAASTLRKITSAANDAVSSYVFSSNRAGERARQEEERNQFFDENDMLYPSPQSTGGRIGRKSGGKVTGNSISREVERTRKELSHRTAQMLSMPDDAIVTALKIAKH